MARGVAGVLAAGLLTASLSGLALGTASAVAAETGADAGTSASTPSAQRSEPRDRQGGRATQREHRRSAAAGRGSSPRSPVLEKKSVAPENDDTVEPADLRPAAVDPVEAGPVEAGPVESGPADTGPIDIESTAADATAAVPAVQRQSSTPRRERLPAPADESASRRTDVEMTAPTMRPAEQNRRPTLLNVVGSMVVNLLIGVVHLVDGPPALPAGSTVTVRTSSLNLPIGKGRTVLADWYFPENVSDTTRLVYLQHGFLASGPMYSYTAAQLAERTNSIVVAPSLSSNFFDPGAAWVGGSTMHRAVAELFVGPRAALTQSVRAAAGYAIDLPAQFVLVGHSAGGTMVTSVAGFMADNGAVENLAGVVMLDGVEPAGSRLLTDALGKLTADAHRPVYLISSERYFWSRGGDMADKLSTARPGEFTGVGLKAGTHIDYMTGGNVLLQLAQYAIGGFSQPRNVHAAGLITAGWVNDLFVGTTENGIYGDPHEVIAVATPAGTATATVLPLGYPARPVWPVWLDRTLTAVFDFLGRNVFVYEPLRSSAATPANSSSARGSEAGASAVVALPRADR
ncbi:alpha/beta hydrolase [Mycolicibacterium vaccae]|uniref:alpha/beta hydrolase n=1 Tax=Mycolicibacterium vaccae TaxID=1810 RepID=UPI003CFD7BC0